MATLKSRAAKIKKLLRGKELAAVVQGVELLRASEDAELVEHLLEGVRVERGRREAGGLAWQWLVPNRTFAGTAREQPLRAFACACCVSLAANGELRDELHALRIHGTIEGTIDLGLLAGLELEGLSLHAHDVTGLPTLPTLTHLSLGVRGEVSLRGLETLTKLEHLTARGVPGTSVDLPLPASVRELLLVGELSATSAPPARCRLERLEATRGALDGLALPAWPTLEVLRVRRLPPAPALSELSALRHLSLSSAEGLTESVLASASLTSLEFRRIDATELVLPPSSTLSRLTIENGPQLERIVGLPKQTSLWSLSVNACPSLDLDALRADLAKAPTLVCVDVRGLGDIELPSAARVADHDDPRARLFALRKMPGEDASDLAGGLLRHPDPAIRAAALPLAPPVALLAAIEDAEAPEHAAIQALAARDEDRPLSRQVRARLAELRPSSSRDALIGVLAALHERGDDLPRPDRPRARAFVDAVVAAARERAAPEVRRPSILHDPSSHPIASLPVTGVPDFAEVDTASVEEVRIGRFNSGGYCRLGDEFVFPPMPKLRIAKLRSRVLTTLRPFARLPSLEVLDVGPNKKLVSLDGVQGLARLRVLYARSTSIKDLTPLADSPLELLGLAHTKVSDLSPILRAGSPLHALHLDNTKVRSLEGIHRLAKLETLTLRETRVEDLEPLTELPGLRRLGLYECVEIASFEPLTRIPGLERVDLFRCTLDDAALLVRIPALRAVRFEQTPLARDEEQAPLLRAYLQRHGVRVDHSPLA